MTTILQLVILLLCICPLFAAEQLGGSEGCFCKLKELVDDCDCDVEFVHQYNNLKVHPLLRTLVEKPYFRFFPVNLQRPCRFWKDEDHCSLRDCRVKGCAIDDIPKGLQPEFLEIEKHRHQDSEYKEPPSVTVSVNAPKKDDCPVDENAGGLGIVDRSLSDDTKEAIKDWNKHDDQKELFCETDDELPGNVEYVDLLRNPERFTGYQGQSANRIWQVIYKENCFPPDDVDSYSSQYSKEHAPQCLEKRIFHRLVSGLHTSITVHLTHDYLLKDMKGLTEPKWGPNVELFTRRFDPKFEPEGPQRLKNLYFIYLVELRAIVKAAPYLRNEKFYTGDKEEDENTRTLVANLMQVAESFPKHFDESRLFREGTPEEIAQLKTAFRQRFYNITRIMDCVGCHKCRLWGKLQIQGLGTALKILFSSDDVKPGSTVPHIEPHSGRKFQLRRTEIVALVNAFSKLSKSIFAVGAFQDLLSKKTV